LLTFHFTLLTLNSTLLLITYFNFSISFFLFLLRYLREFNSFIELLLEIHKWLACIILFYRNQECFIP
jgi:hypothetical protein